MKKTVIELWEILVPQINNQTNKPFEFSHHQKWDEFVNSRIGGLTIHKPVHGEWFCNTSKNIITEKMIPVRIACQYSQLEEIVQFTIEHYRQESVMVFKISDTAFIFSK